MTLEPVDPALVPQRIVTGGAAMPAIGLGTFGSDHVTGERVAAAVYDAIRLGYRHIDCAAVYANEHLVGESLERAMAEFVRRDELWITSKLWNDRHEPSLVAPALEQTLRDLRLEHLDLYLVHWPFPNTHQPGVDVGSPTRTHSRTGTNASWRPGPSSRSSSTAASSGTSARRT